MDKITFKSTKQKLIVQVILLVISVAFIGFGAYRGEAKTVFTKAMNLCLEYVKVCPTKAISVNWGPEKMKLLEKACELNKNKTTKSVN
ncbi:CD1871A family CXXC motif-containing protein [Peptoniphilus sp. Marseille-Q6390]